MLKTLMYQCLCIILYNIVALIQKHLKVYRGKPALDNICCIIDFPSNDKNSILFKFN